MACPSLIALPRVCGSAGIVGGVNKLYAVSFADLAVPEGATTDEVYTMSVAGMVNEIGLDASKKFIEIGLLPASASLAETLTKEKSNGSSFMTQTFTMVLSDMNAENRAFVETVMNQPVAIIIKTKSKKYFVAGLNGDFELSAIEGGTGTAQGDLVGYTLTFTGTDSMLIPQVDPTIISDLI